MRSSEGTPATFVSGGRRYAIVAIGNNYSDDEILEGGRTSAFEWSTPNSTSGFQDGSAVGEFDEDTGSTSQWSPQYYVRRRRKSEDYGRCSVPGPPGLMPPGSSMTSFPPAVCLAEAGDDDYDGAALPSNGRFDHRSWRNVDSEFDDVSGFRLVDSVGAAANSSYPVTTYAARVPGAVAMSNGGSAVHYGSESHPSRATRRPDRISGCNGIDGDKITGAGLSTSPGNSRQLFVDRFSSLVLREMPTEIGRSSTEISKHSFCETPSSRHAELNRRMQVAASTRDDRRIKQTAGKAYRINMSQSEIDSRFRSNEPDVVMRRTTVEGRTMPAPSSVVYFYERASICDVFPPSLTSSCVAVDQLPPLSANSNRKSRVTPEGSHMTPDTSRSADNGSRRTNSFGNGRARPSSEYAETGSGQIERHIHKHRTRRHCPENGVVLADEGFGDEGNSGNGRSGVDITHAKLLADKSNVPVDLSHHQSSTPVSGSSHVCCKCAMEAWSSLAALQSSSGLNGSSSQSSSSTSSLVSTSVAPQAAASDGPEVPPPTVAHTSPLDDRNRKRSYRVGLNLFNKNPEQGIKYLRDRQFLDLRPTATAKFLITRKGLSKQMIGEYLGGTPTPFLSEVLRNFAEQINVANMEIDEALRKFQTYFRMPGEAQKIERIIEVFANQYCECNPTVADQFVNTDTVFLLSFAIMMLNTDLHNKNVRQERKMKLEDFIRNLRGVDGGSDVDPVLLSAIYERIRQTEFAPGEDHVTQVQRVEQMLVGKKPPLSPALHRRLVCYCRLQEIIDPGRRQRPTQHQREVFLFNDMLLVAKVVGRQKNALSYSYRQSFSLTSMGVYLFEGAYYQYGICLTNTVNDKVLIMLTARNEHDRKNFIEDLKEAVLENAEMQSLESGQSDAVMSTSTPDSRLPQPSSSSVLKTADQARQSSNVNRYSNDSGVVDVVEASAEVHQPLALVSGGGSSSSSSRSRPHSIHSGSEQGSASSLTSISRSQQGQSQSFILNRRAIS